MRQVFQELREQIFAVSKDNFETIALDVFKLQARHSTVYRTYLEYLNFDPVGVKEIQEIPFLPIELFKTHAVITEGLDSEITFSSSGTGQSGQSRHYVADEELYHRSFYQSFKYFYGGPSEYCFLALLPSYLEREGSSLVYMINQFIKQSKYESSGFYLHNQSELIETIQKLEIQNIPCMLWGVSFALWELAEQYELELNHTTIMETGGMKGKRKEITRSELHHILKASFGSKPIHSEYGMTELLSQAYAIKDGLFECPPWMRVLIREVNDPFCYLPDGRTGAINIIDLANLYSCSFIASSDLGQINEQQQFTVSGRMDSSDQRGCNLLI